MNIIPFVRYCQANCFFAIETATEEHVRKSFIAFSFWKCSSTADLMNGAADVFLSSYSTNSGAFG